MGIDKKPGLPSLPERRPIDFLQVEETRQATEIDPTTDLLNKAAALMEDPANDGIMLAQHCSHGSQSTILKR